MSDPPVIIQIGATLTDEAAAELRTRLEEVMRKPFKHVVLSQDERWVLVKGWHDTGTIDGVYGPYTKERAEWFLAEMLEYHTGNWTLAELQTGPKP